MAIKKEQTITKPTNAIVTIAKDPLNPYDAYQFVAINGREYNILKGESVEVPLEVAELLRDTKVIVDFIIVK